MLYRGSIVLVRRGLVVLLDPLVRSELRNRVLVVQNMCIQFPIKLASDKIKGSGENDSMLRYLVLRGSLLGGVVVELLRGLVEAGLRCVVPSLYGWGIVLRERHFY